jgi:type VI secretion system secreted protein Hcp
MSETSFDAYVQIEGITGESMQKDHVQWIDADSLVWGATRGGNMDMGGAGGGTTGKANFTPVTFSHLVDKTSPVLFQFCAQGKHISKVVIHVCKSTGEAAKASEKFIQLELTGVIISDVSHSCGGSAAPMESVSLSYSTIKVEVREQGDKGSLGAAVTGSWDIKQNKTV